MMKLSPFIFMIPSITRMFQCSFLIMTAVSSLFCYTGS